MRYELTCPACGQMKSTPFVRLGAVAVCAPCGHRFPVKADYVKAMPTPPVALKPGEADPLLAGASLATAEHRPAGLGESTPPPDQLARLSSPRPTGTNRASGASGAPLSPPPPPPASPTEGLPSVTPPPPTAAPAPSRPQEVMPDRRAQRLVEMQQRRRQQLMLLAGITALVIVASLAVTVSLIIFQTPESDAQAPLPEEIEQIVIGGTPSNDDVAVVARINEVPDNLQYVNATPMAIWYAGQVDDVEVESAGPFQLERPGFTKVGDDWIFEATLTGRGVSPNGPATFRLGLIDQEQRVYVWYDLPIPAMVHSEPREKVELAVSDALYRRMLRYTWTVKTGSAIGGGAALKDIAVRPLTDRARATVHVTAYNPVQRQAARAVILLIGYDQSNDEVGQWMVHWNQPVGPGQRIEFGAFLSSRRDLGVHRWRAEGAVLFAASP